MKQVLITAWRLIKDEAGGEAMEYSIIAGLIVAASFVPISCYGLRVLARWQSVNSSI